MSVNIWGLEAAVTGTINLKGHRDAGETVAMELLTGSGYTMLIRL